MLLRSAGPGYAPCSLSAPQPFWLANEGSFTGEGVAAKQVPEANFWAQERATHLGATGIHCFKTTSHDVLLSNSTIYI